MIVGGHRFLLAGWPKEAKEASLGTIHNQSSEDVQLAAVVRHASSPRAETDLFTSHLECLWYGHARQYRRSVLPRVVVSRS